MRKTLHLFVIQLKSRFRPIRTGRSKSAASRIGLGILLLMSFASLAFLYFGFYDSLLDAAISVLDMPELAIDIAVLVTILQAVLFGVFFTFGELFMSTDGAFLTSLPLKGWQVFTAKFLYLYLIHLALSALALVPPVVLYAIKVGVGIAYYFKALLVLLVLPIFPLLVSVLFSIVLMVLMLPIRRKDLVITIGSFLFIFGYVGLQFWFTSRIDSDAAFSNFLGDLLDKYWSTIRSITQPPASWASAAITGTPYVSLISLVLFLITAFIALWLVIVIAGPCYRRFATVNAETSSSGRKRKRTEKDTAQKSPVWAFFAKEWRVVARSTVYATNSLISAPLILICLLFPMMQKQDNVSYIVSYILFLAKTADPGVIALILAGIIALPTSMNMGAFTAFSREGTGFWQIKTLPASAETVIGGKLLFGASVNLIHAVPLALLGLFWMKVSPLAILGGFLLGMCLSAAATAAGMLIDAQRPKLTWVNEAEAIKQNMNGFFGMLISFALVALVGVGCAALLLETNLPVLLLFVAALALSAALLILFYLALVKIARSAWPGIDV